MWDLNDPEPCLAAMNPPRLYNFYPTEAADQNDLARANAGILDPAAGYVVITYRAYKQAERAFYLADPLTEISRADWIYALGVLPPLCWERAGGVERFMASEFQTSTFTRQYARLDGRYWTRVVDAEDRQTWITAREIEATL